MRIKTTLALGLISLAALPMATLAQETESASSTPPAASSTAPMEDPYKIAVKPFKSNKYTYEKHELTPGKDIARILETRLSKNRFIVMSRSDLDEVVEEQKLSNSELFNAEGAPVQNKLEGVELLVTGQIVEFNIEKGKQSGSTFLGFGSVKKDPDKVNISIEVSLVDTESGRVVANATCRESYNLGEGTTASTHIFGGDATVEEKDAIPAIHNVYYLVADNLAKQINEANFQARASKVMLEGAVGLVDGDTVYIKMGRKQGITDKMVFKVVRPYKGMEVTIAEIKPTSIDEEQSECKILTLKKNADGTNKVIKPGDIFKTKL